MYDAGPTLKQHWVKVSCLLCTRMRGTRDNTILWYRPIEIHHRASTNFPADTRRWINAGLTLVQRRRRWINIKTTLIQRLVSAGSPQTAYIDPELRQTSPQLLGQQKQFNLSHGISRLPVRIGGGSIHSPATYRRKRWVRWNPCTARPVYWYRPIGAYVVTAIHISNSNFNVYK